MNSKKTHRLAAVIHIDSNALKIKIAQLKKGEISDIDILEYPMQLGHEVFKDGKISFKSLRELSSHLHGYQEVLADYAVKDVKTVATTALREAENRSFIMDQLKIQNGIPVTVLEDNQEKSLIYWEILNHLGKMEQIKNDSALICYIGAGSIGLAVYDGKEIIHSQNIPIGSLRIHDMLDHIQTITENFDTVIEEYISSILWHINISLGSGKANHLILTGNGVRLIGKICALDLTDGIYELEALRLHTCYEEIRNMPQNQISQKYNLSEETAELLYSSMAIAIKLLEYTTSATILTPNVDLWDALICQMLIPKSREQYQQHVRTSATACARRIADYYCCNRAHTECVREFSCKIFDKMKKVHGLDCNERLLLELAAILHECGHYVTAKQHLQSTFDIIKDTDIYGLTNEEILLTAFVARHNEYDVPNPQNTSFASLSDKNRLIVSKLVAIFRLANALDKSQKQKLSNIKVRFENNHLTISAQCDTNVYLEQWAFAQCAPYFEEVFGFQTELILKSNLL
ncbi:MAG: Guanosine-5'-triphosphate,3'-diphosphate pyrophosphatase [Oscillospiraceae bacterium]